MHPGATRTFFRDVQAPTLLPAYQCLLQSLAGGRQNKDAASCRPIQDLPSTIQVVSWGPEVWTVDSSRLWKLITVKNVFEKAQPTPSPSISEPCADAMYSDYAIS